MGLDLIYPVFLFIAVIVMILFCTLLRGGNRSRTFLLTLPMWVNLIFMGVIATSGGIITSYNPISGNPVVVAPTSILVLFFMVFIMNALLVFKSR